VWLNLDLNLHFSDRAILKYFYDSDQYLSRIVDIRKLFNYQKRINIINFYKFEDLGRYLGWTVPEWVVATSLGRNILVLDYEIWKARQWGSVNQIILHELVHVILSNYKVKVPLWLNEGLALYLAGQWDDGQVKREGFVIKNIYDLNYNNTDVYAVSGGIVAKLINIYGLAAIIARIPEVVDFRSDVFFGEKSISSLLAQN
jgi:hypothetical protein